MKYAIVTGGSSGIGKGVATMLLKKGYHVFITYAFDPNIEDAKKELKAISDEVELFEIDQTIRENTYHFISHVKKLTNHVDCIICNAGITRRSSFTETKDEDWDAMMEVAINSHYIMIRELYPIIPNGSRIVFTGSAMGLYPHGTVLAYGVTKAWTAALVTPYAKTVP